MSDFGDEEPDDSDLEYSSEEEVLAWIAGRTVKKRKAAASTVSRRRRQGRRVPLLFDSVDFSGELGTVVAIGANAASVCLASGATVVHAVSDFPGTILDDQAPAALLRVADSKPVISVACSTGQLLLAPGDSVKLSVEDHRSIALWFVDNNSSRWPERTATQYRPGEAQYQEPGAAVGAWRGSCRGILVRSDGPASAVA